MANPSFSGEVSWPLAEDASGDAVPAPFSARLDRSAQQAAAAAEQVMRCRQRNRLWAGNPSLVNRAEAYCGARWLLYPGPRTLALNSPRDPRDLRLGCRTRAEMPAALLEGMSASGLQPAHGRTRMASRLCPSPRARLHHGDSDCRRAGCSWAGDRGCGLDHRGTSTGPPPHEDRCGPAGVTQQPVNLRRNARHTLNGCFPDQLLS